MDSPNKPEEAPSKPEEARNKCTISIEDEGDGFTILPIFDPPLKKGQTDYTPAQGAALCICKYVEDLMAGRKPFPVDPDVVQGATMPAGGPQLLDNNGRPTGNIIT